MSRRPARWIGISTLCLAGYVSVAPLAAQEAQSDDTDATSAPVRQPIEIEPIERSDSVNLLIETPKGEIDQRRVERCEEEQDASAISGEIVVCREIVEDNSNYFSGSRANAHARYAEETQFADVYVPIDTCGGFTCGIFKGPATVGSLCIPGLQKCPPPPALIIDVTALPQAPAGSDADRIARGLPPLGNDQGDADSDPNADEPSDQPAVNPAESEEPAEAQ